MSHFCIWTPSAILEPAFVYLSIICRKKIVRGRIDPFGSYVRSDWANTVPRRVASIELLEKPKKNPQMTQNQWSQSTRHLKREMVRLYLLRYWGWIEKDTR